MIKNKEFGSDFHYLLNDHDKNITSDHFLEKHVDQYYFSGRVALYEIINFGIENLGWKKIYAPTYYCHEVYHFIQNLNITIEFYKYNPIDNQIEFEIEDSKDHAILNVNYFGIISPNFSDLKKVSIIDDITHDLTLIENSCADFIFGSLRKTLPVPVGGFVKSKYQLRKILSNEFSEEIAIQKITAMYLKSQYLKGLLESKDMFRKLFIDAENNFENLQTVSLIPATSKTIIDSQSFQKIIDTKKNNLKVIKSTLVHNDIFSLITSIDGNDFACILRFDNKKNRDELRNHLIHSNIFPMVLWPNQINEMDKHIEDTLLFIHVDFRYDANDMKYISKTINEFYKN